MFCGLAADCSGRKEGEGGGGGGRSLSTGLGVRALRGALSTLQSRRKVLFSNYECPMLIRKQSCWISFFHAQLAVSRWKGDHVPALHLPWGWWRPQSRGDRPRRDRCLPTQGEHLCTKSLMSIQVYISLLSESACRCSWARKYIWVLCRTLYIKSFWLSITGKCQPESRNVQWAAKEAKETSRWHVQTPERWSLLACKEQRTTNTSQAEKRKARWFTILRTWLRRWLGAEISASRESCETRIFPNVHFPNSSRLANLCFWLFVTDQSRVPAGDLQTSDSQSRGHGQGRIQRWPQV